MTDFNKIPNRRSSSNSAKWTSYPKDVLPMWVADMDFPSAPQILDALHKQVEHGVLGYEYPSKALYETIAARMKKLYGWEVDPQAIVCTAGVNNGYNIAARVLCTRDKGYLIQTPVYNEFLETGDKTGVSQLVAPLAESNEGNTLTHEVDFDALERGAKKAGMFLLCNPHNPVGHIFSSEELTRMAGICIENKVTIVADEIHSELLLGAAKFTPLASLSPEIEKNTITLVSASKAFNVAGLSCAFAIIPDSELRKQFNAAVNGMSFEFSTPGLIAAQVAYSGKADPWLKDLRRYLTANRDYVVEYVTKYLPGIRTTIPDATYLAWFDCTQLGLKENPYDFFFKNARVAFSNGEKFGEGGEDHIRLNFGTSRMILKQGLDRMRKALNQFNERDPKGFENL